MLSCVRCQAILVADDNWRGFYLRTNRKICIYCKRKESRKFRENNPSYHSTYVKNNKTKVNQHKKKWENENLPKVNYYNSLKRARRKSARCPEADPLAIRELYKLSYDLTKATGIRYHVDHIVPISKGGLHHENNLQVIPATLNYKKSGKLPDELPKELEKEINAQSCKFS